MALALPPCWASGVFMMTIDQGADTERYPGRHADPGRDAGPLGRTLFRPVRTGSATKVRLAVGQVQTTGALNWRAGGLIVQNIAGDESAR